jgi:uncharacterized protein YwgA
MLAVPLGFQFVLYKHGPYSFELTDELTGLRADGILNVEVPDTRYGPRYLDGDSAGFATSRFPNTIERYRDKIEFLAKKIGKRGIADLERIATAFFVRVAQKELSVERRARQLVQLTPHIPKSDALAATREIDTLIQEANLHFNST